MRKVLQVLGRSAGGIARHVARVTESLDGETGLIVDIAGPPDLPVPMPKPLHHVVIPDGPRGHRAPVRALRDLVRSGGYDVVHAHGLRAGIDSGLATRRTGVRRLVTIHNLVRPEIARARTRLYRAAEDLAVRLNDVTFAVSNDIATHLQGRLPRHAERIETLHLGAGPVPEVRSDRASVRERLGVPHDHALIVTASRLAPQKSVDVMLHALTLLSTPSVLAILGTGPLEVELRALCGRLRLDDRVRWVGFRDDIADHLAAADAFCLSSVWEGVPLAAMEAIQLGTPVVATDVGGMSELITDGRSGRLVEAGLPRPLADALREVLTQEDKRAKYVANARADLEANFSTERMLDRLRQAYLGGSHA